MSSSFALGSPARTEQISIPRTVHLASAPCCPLVGTPQTGGDAPLAEQRTFFAFFTPYFALWLKFIHLFIKHARRP